MNAYDLAYREAKSAVNAGAILEGAVEYKTVADAVSDCSLVVGTTAAQHRELNHRLRRLEHAGTLLTEALAAAPVALMFGRKNTAWAMRTWLIASGCFTFPHAMSMSR